MAHHQAGFTDENGNHIDLATAQAQGLIQGVRTENGFKFAFVPKSYNDKPIEQDEKVQVYSPGADGADKHGMVTQTIPKGSITNGTLQTLRDSEAAKQDARIKNQSEVNKNNAEANEANQRAQLAAKQASDPDSLTPKERFELRKSGQGEASKANKDFNTFLGSANSIEGSIRLSKDGNELASAIIPLQGTLFITTAEGVKRINETELSGVANAGSIARRGQNAYEKFLKGDTSAATKNDLIALVHAYKEAKYQQYLNNQSLTAHNYGLKPEEFQVFDKDGKPTSLADATKQAAPPPPGATNPVYAADGKTLIGHVVAGKFVGLN